MIRDMMFGNRRHFRELLAHSQEGIASNILADRLRKLLAHGIVWKRDDPSHRQKSIYSLTERGIELLPIFAMVGAWGLRHLPVTEELGIRARLLEEGGPALWERFMQELRAEHLGAAGSGAPVISPSVREQLQAAYEGVIAEQRARA